MLSDKIVVIDDDPKVIQAIKMILREYEIYEFHDANKAIDYLKRPNEFSAVLLDIYMKEVNGIDILKEIKGMEKKMPVIIMTAFGSKDIVLEALRGKADDFIEKPFNVAELRDKIRALLKTQSHFQNLDRHNRMERIKRFIERNCDNISLEHIAEELCLSPKYISRLFRSHDIGCFRDFKVKVKIDKAKSLLSESSFTVCQIADMLGYQNAESFMRIFKRTTQLTPTQYRVKYRKQSKTSND